MLGNHELFPQLLHLPVVLNLVVPLSDDVCHSLPVRFYLDVSLLFFDFSSGKSQDSLLSFDLLIDLSRHG